MSRLPTPTAVQHLAASLRALNEPPAKGKPRRIDDMEARLLAALARDKAGSPVPDGYPTNTAGGARAGESSSVEAAVIALQAPIRDQHHDLVARACEALDRCVVAANTLAGALASLDDLGQLPTTQAPRTCQHCTPCLPKANTRPVHRRGTVGDRLPRALDLCEPCYFFVQRSAKPGSQEGELPTPEQIRFHDEHGRWRMRVA